MDHVRYLSDQEIKHFVSELDQDNNGYIDYWEIEHKLDAIAQELDPKPKLHHLHHPDRDEARHRFLRVVLGTDKDMIPRSEFAQSVRQWKIPSMEQDRREAKDEDEYLSSLSLWRRFCSYWAVKGPEILFLALVISVQLAFGLWQMIKYLTQMQYRHAFGWGVVLAKTSAGVLYPTFFFVILSMSRYFATSLRKYYFVSRFINWDLSQSFHVKMSIVALVFATLHAIGHLTGSFLYGSRPAQQDDVAAVLGPDAVPKPYVDYVRTLPGWTGLTALGLFYTLALLSMPAIRKRTYELFQLGHLLMYPIIGLLMAHGTAGLLQWPMFGYWLAFPTLLVLIERSVRVALGLHHIPAELEVLDAQTVVITATIPSTRLWRYRAGQYILLQVPKISLLQWHPFTISTCVGNRMQVHIKTDGDWTSKLRGLAENGQPEVVKVGIDGPFGAPAQRFYDFQYSIVVGSGIGITPFSGILTDLQERALRRTDSEEEVSPPDPSGRIYRKIEFLWMVRERNNLLWFADLLNEVSKAEASRSPTEKNLDIRIHTYVTQKRKKLSTHIFRWLIEQHRTPEDPQSPLTGLINPTHFGRPDLPRIMSEHYEDMRKLLASENQKEKGGSGKALKGLRVGVFFCGAPVVGYQLADQCRLLSARGRDDGSRIQYHFMMEVFG